MRKKKYMQFLFGILITIMLMSFGSLTVMAKNSGTWFTKNGRYYYLDQDGNKLKDGKYKIGKRYYYFDEKGIQRTGWQKVGKNYYYFNIADGKKGYMKTSTTVNGIKLRKSGKAKVTSYSKKKLPILYKANVKMREITKVRDSKEKKLKKCWNYILTSFKTREWIYLSNLGSFQYRNGKWDIYYARKIFANGGGGADCYAASCVFAYLANACGYNAKVVSSGKHGWAEINDRVYDLYWAYTLNDNSFYNRSYDHPRQNGIGNYKGNRRYVITI